MFTLYSHIKSQLDRGCNPMVHIPRSSIQQRVGTGNMRCGRGCEEQREPSDIGGCTKAAGGLDAREGFFAGSFQAKGGHFGGEQAG